MRELPQELLTGPFTVTRAGELGVGRQVLRGRRFVTPFRGVRLAAPLDGRLEVCCRAAALVLPSEAAFSHETALRLWGLPTPIGRRPCGLHVMVPRGRAIPYPDGVHGHDALMTEQDVVVRAGVRVVRPERTLCDAEQQLQPVGGRGLQLGPDQPGVQAQQAHPAPDPPDGDVPDGAAAASP